MKMVAWHVGSKKDLANSLAKKTHKTLAPGKTLVAAAVGIPGKEDGFLQVMGAILGIADYLCWGVIVFCGAVWMMGNRTKALEHFIGGCSGYLIIRNAIHIRDWLRGLS